MREYLLELFGPKGESVGSEVVRLAEVPGRTVLHRLARRSVLAKDAKAATLSQGRAIHALFLATELLPPKVVGTSGQVVERGAWFTASASIGPAVRGLFGPDAFVRQADLTAPWLAPILMRFAPKVEVREYHLADGWVVAVRWPHPAQRSAPAGTGSAQAGQANVAAWSDTPHPGHAARSSGARVRPTSPQAAQRKSRAGASASPTGTGCAELGWCDSPATRLTSRRVED